MQKTFHVEIADMALGAGVAFLACSLTSNAVSVLTTATAMPDVMLEVAPGATDVSRRAPVVHSSLDSRCGIPPRSLAECVVHSGIFILRTGTHVLENLQAARNT